MADYAHRGHTVTELRYHFVWVTKYGYPVLRGEIELRGREVIRQVCESREITIIKGAVSREHVHLYVSAPPHLAPAQMMQWIKGRSCRRLQEEFDELLRRLLGPASVGAVVFLRERRPGERRDDPRACRAAPGPSTRPGLPGGGAGVSAAGFSR